MPKPSTEPHALVTGNASARSWREKLDLVCGWLADDARTLSRSELADAAIYLRFLSTGEIPCTEDGRHFRPSHHARIATQIHERLARLATTEDAFLIRRILVCLPSTAAPFQRAEPLTRIRDIAHRNDIPQDLKREIKTTLQNKLHRCAGPEDLVTSARLLERITAPDAHCSGDFVEQFRIFHGELTEFFNARSLEERLNALAPNADAATRELIQNFLAAKHHANAEGRLTALTLLTELRQHLLTDAAGKAGAEHQELCLADIALEDFAFALLSELLNQIEFVNLGLPADDMGAALNILALTLVNLRLSQIAPGEVSVVESELAAARTQLKADDRESLLRLKATIERARRAAGEFSDGVLALLPERATTLGNALGVAPHAIRVFAEAEIRAHLVFQLDKLASALLRQFREALQLPPWDVLVTGEACGRLVATATITEVGAIQKPLILLLAAAAGDEEIPTGVTGILLAHELPHLSHLGVRARQAGVVVACCEEESLLAELRERVGQPVSVRASSEGIQVTAATESDAIKSVAGKTATAIPKVILQSKLAVLPVEKITPATGGNKADGVRQLLALALRKESGFSAPAGLVVPFGVMEACLRADSKLHENYQSLVARVNQCTNPYRHASGDHLAGELAGGGVSVLASRGKVVNDGSRGRSPHRGTAKPAKIGDQCTGAEFAGRVAQIRELINGVKVPEEIAAAAVSSFGKLQRLAVRSSANSEDLPDMAGAGLHESVVGVTAGEVASAVQTVWASLWTERAAASRRQAGIPHEAAHMAVLIQPLVEPELSFILHTVNPLNHSAQECYVELAVGLGETLASVAARGTPYRLVCDRESGQVTMLAFANFSHALEAGADGQLTERRLDYSGVPFTTDGGVRAKLGARLAQVASFIERAFGAPQDVEGVICGEEIILVQSRTQQGIPPRTDER